MSVLKHKVLGALQNQGHSWFMRAVTIITVLVLIMPTFSTVSAAANPKIDICHATASNNNPYTGANASETADAGGHDGHTGPVWFSGITVAWGDIIPPFTNGNITYPGMNWTAEGQAILNNNCNIPTVPSVGSLLVTKNTIGGNGTFNFTGTGTIGTFPITTVANTGSQTFINLTPGAVTVTEDVNALAAGWALTSNTCVAVSIVAGQQAACTITNTYTPPAANTGTLEITKTSIGGNATFDFTGTGGLGNFQIATSNNTGTHTFNNLAPGSYTITEGVLPTGWSQNTSSCTAVQVSNGQKATCNITNTYTPPIPQTGTLHITKTSIGGDATFNFTGDNGVAPFQLTTVQGSAMITITGIPQGSVTITEGTLPTNWSQTSNGCVNKTIMAGEQTSCTIVNTYSPPVPDTSHLTLVKTLAGDATTDLNTAWTLSAAGATPISGVTGNATVTNAVVTSGTYILSETGPTTGYTASNWTCTAPNSDNVQVPVTVTGGNMVTLLKNQNVTCTIINTFTASTPHCLGLLNVAAVDIAIDVRHCIISGHKYNDLNGNGVLDSGETGLQNWTIYLDANNNGSLDGGELSTTTDANGFYQFANLVSGTYHVREVNQAGWTQTLPSGGDGSIIAVLSLNELTNQDFLNHQTPAVPCLIAPIIFQSGTNTQFLGLKEGTIPADLTDATGYPAGTPGAAVAVGPTGFPGAWDGLINDSNLSGAIFVSNDATQPSSAGGVGFDGTVDSWRLFSQSFTIPTGSTNISTPTLYFGADNEVIVYLDGVQVGTSNSFITPGSTAPLTLTPGTHKLLFAVKNDAYQGENNPTGLIYKMALTYCPGSDNTGGGGRTPPTTSGGGGTPLVPRVLGDTTTVPSYTPQVLGATTTLPVTGKNPNTLILLILVLSGILSTSVVLKIKRV